MVKVNTWVFILRRYKWHIHAGSWSLVNCWREGSMLPYEGCSWILMNVAVGLTAGLGLDGDRCIRVIPRQYLSLCHRETQRNSSCRFGAVRCLSFRERDFLLYFEHYWGCIQAYRFWWLYWVYWIQGITAAQQPLKYLLTELLSVFVLWEAISLSVVTYDKVETRDWCMWCFLTFLSTD